MLGTIDFRAFSAQIVEIARRDLSLWGFFLTSFGFRCPLKYNNTDNKPYELLLFREPSVISLTIGCHQS